MYRITECKLAQKLKASENRGLIIGVAIGLLVCLCIIGAVVKLCCLKKKFSNLECELDEFDADFEDEDCDCDENGCTYTSERDFV